MRAPSPLRLPLFPKLSALVRRCDSLVGPVLFLALWSLATELEWCPPTVLVSPRQVWAAAIDLWASGELQTHLEASAARVIIGFIIGGGSGIAAGLLLGLFKPLERYCSLLFHILRQVPFITWGPMLIMILGVGEPFKILIIANAAFFPAALNAWDGVRNIPPSYHEIARILGFSRISLLRRLLLPHALSPILTGLRLALSRSWMIVVGAELFASSQGIGHMMDWAREMFQLDVVMVGVLVTGIIGFALDRLLRFAEARLSPWQAQPETVR